MINPPDYEFIPNPRITLKRMYEIINCAGTYHQLPDNMKKLHPFIFDTSHIKSVIDRTYMAVLVDARGKGRINSSNEDKEKDSDSDASSVFLDDYDMQLTYAEHFRGSKGKYRDQLWHDTVVEDHLQMKSFIEYLAVLLPFDMGFFNQATIRNKVKCFCHLHKRFGPLHVSCERYKLLEYFNMTCSIGKNGAFKDGEDLKAHYLSVGDWPHRLVHNYLVEMYPTSVARQG